MAMKSAVIILDEKSKSEKALRPVLDKTVLDFIVHDLKEAGADVICIQTSEDIKIEDAVCTKTLFDAIETIGIQAGELIVFDDVYPFLKVETIKRLYDHKASRLNGTKVIKVDMMDLVDLKDIDFTIVEALKEELDDIDDHHAYHRLWDHYHHLINDYHAENGVIILDPKTTYIGPEVRIEAGAIIENNVTIYGDSYIGANTRIGNGSFIENAQIGKNNVIMSSRITDSKIHDDITLGPYAHLRNNTEVFSNTRIGNFVEFKNTRFGHKSRCAHLTYLGDCTVGEDVNIGCGVVTVNYDGAHKYRTEIGDHAFIGSNSNLVAPLKVGAYALVAAGSTITNDVNDSDMAIARPFQTIKEGYGYKYINKEK